MPEYLILWSRVFVEKLIVTQVVKTFPAFMELRGSVPCLQDPAAGSCHELKLRGFGPLANYADRATAACWRSSANFLQIEGVVWSAQRIPPVVSLGFLDQSHYYLFQVAPQLSSRG
jgi:hypothetical protein